MTIPFASPEEEVDVIKVAEHELELKLAALGLKQHQVDFICQHFRQAVQMFGDDPQSIADTILRNVQNQRDLGML